MKGDNKMSLRHLVDFNELTAEEWEGIYTLAADIKKNPANYSEACKGKILATLFYEPSTRTMLSFQTAMLRLVRWRVSGPARRRALMRWIFILMRLI